MINRTMFRLGAVCLALACTPAHRAPFQEPAPASRVEDVSGSRRDLVTAAELQAVPGVYTTLEVLRRVRPEFLTRRAAPVPSDPDAGFPVVYLDGRWLGALRTLEGIPLATVIEIRYLRSVAATEQLGRSHPGGVIAVSTYR